LLVSRDVAEQLGVFDSKKDDDRAEVHVIILTIDRGGGAKDDDRRVREGEENAERARATAPREERGAMVNAGIADSVDKVNSSVAGPNGQAKNCRLRRGAQNPGSSCRETPWSPSSCSSCSSGRSREEGGGARGLARVDQDSHPGWHELERAADAAAIAAAGRLPGFRILDTTTTTTWRRRKGETGPSAPSSSSSTP